MSALLLAAACAAASSYGPQADDARGGSRGDRLVRVDLIADRARIVPGEAFSLGVKLTVEPGWHIYWENPGDSGYPTQATIHGPEGFEIGSLRFPAPEREVEEGDIVTYDLRGEVVLVADVRAPMNPASNGGHPPDSSAAFEVEASWLVCKAACFPGSGQANLAVPISPASSGPSGDAPAAPANEKSFAAARARLPRPWSELRGAEMEWIGGGEDPALRIAVPDATELDLFPLPSATTSLESRSTTRSSQGDMNSCNLTAKLHFRGESPEDRPRVRGVLRVVGEKGESFFHVDSVMARPAGARESR